MRRILSFQLVSSTSHILIAVALLGVAGYRGGLLYLVHSVLTLGALVLASGPWSRPMAPVTWSGWPTCCAARRRWPGSSAWP